MNEPPDNPTPVVQKKALIPPGVLPRNAQTWFIAGISILMILVIGLSGGKQPKEKTSSKAPVPQMVDPNAQRIQEYRERIDAQAQKLAAEQAQLVQAKQAFGMATGSPVATPPSAYTNPAPPTSYSAERPPEKNAIEADKEKREYQSLFASNISLSYREEAKTEKEPLVSNESRQTGNDIPRVNVQQETSGTKSVKADPRLQLATGPKYRLFEGTVIETVLTNRLDGSFSGPVNCMVTTNVYSHDGQHLLVPQGARVLGEVKHAETFGQERLAVTFHRLIMPDGYTINLDQFEGLNQIGETGLRDQVNHHYLQVFGVSLAIGAIAGFSQYNTQAGIDASAADAYRQGVASSLSQSSMRILDRYLNILPTYTIREGHRVKVYLAGDLLLPAYDNHQMPSDL